MVETYQAPRPSYSAWEWIKFFLIRLVFPPVLLWDATKLLVNALFGQLLVSQILPAQDDDSPYDKIEEDASPLWWDRKNKYLLIKKHKVLTHDKACLDTLEIEYEQPNPYRNEPRTYIINFVGNQMGYEDIIEEMKRDASELETNVIGFNFRGVRSSSGRTKSKDDLVNDGIAQVQRLLDKGIYPQNITLKGHSLGAGVASLVALHFHQLGLPVNIFNGRSFSSITNFAVGYVRKFKEGIGRKILGWLATPIIKLALSLSNWEIDAASAFKSIPEAYRNYIVVRPSKENRNTQIGDGVIPHYASMHKALSSERRAQKAMIDEQLAKIDSPAEKAELEDRRKQISAGKMQISFDYDGQGHNVSLESLSRDPTNDRYTTAGAFFRNFVRKAREDHGVVVDSSLTPIQL